MDTSRARWPRFAYLVSAAALALTLVISWIGMDRATTKAQLELAERNRVLQVELARNAMEEGFHRLLKDTRILSVYSFPEFLRGRRDAASIVALLELELELNAESLVYGFFEEPGEARFLESKPGAEAAAAALGDAVREIWNGFGGSGDPIVLNGVGADPEPFFIVFFPVYSGGSMSGVLGTAIGLGRAIDKYLEPLAEGSGRRSFLMFGAGRIVWASDDHNKNLFELEAGSLMTSRSFSLGNGEFTIIADESRASLYREIRSRDGPRIVALLAAALVLAAVLFTANLAYLEAMKRAALQEEERRLAERVAVRERELEESGARFGKLFEGAKDGIVIIDSGYEIVACNASAAAMFGLPAGSVVGRTPAELSPELQPNGGASLDIAHVLFEKAARGEAQTFEWRHSRADGSVFDAEISLSSFSDAGSALFQAFIRDISERKRNDRLLRDALEDREILLRELHHRVKNNFQFLESLIELQKGGESDEIISALSKIQSRTQALAAAYLITADRDDSLRVDIDEYLHVLASQVVDAASVGLRFDVVIDSDDLPLSLDVAVSIGLLFRELMTNAVNHGYGGSSGGRIEVSLSRAGNVAALRVRDFGRGMAAGTGDKLGLTIVRALAAQLNGAVSIDAADPGTLAEARFPLP